MLHIRARSDDSDDLDSAVARLRKSGINIAGVPTFTIAPDHFFKTDTVLEVAVLNSVQMDDVLEQVNADVAVVIWPTLERTDDL